MNILITATFDSHYIGKLIEKHFVIYEDWQIDEKCLEGENLINKLNENNIDIFITEIDVINKEVMDACPSLKLICDCRGNPTNVNISYAIEKGIVLTTTPGRNAVAVAEFCIGLIIALSRNILKGDMLIRTNSWKEEAYTFLSGMEISDKKIGLIGFGAIGQTIARLLTGFKPSILVYDPFVSPEVLNEYNVESVDLKTIFSQCDIVSNHLPELPETNGLISKELLSLMDSHSYFINTGRASAVDKEFLLKLLRNKKIAGAALDVFEEEPLPENSEYISLDNVIVTPHIAGATADVVIKQSEMVVEDIECFLKGKEPTNLYSGMRK